MALESPPPPPSFDSPPDEEESHLRETDRERLAEIVSASSPTPKDTLRALLGAGRKSLGVDTGFLAQIHPGRGTHKTVALVGDCSSLGEDDVYDLGDSYCRAVIASNDLVSLHDVSAAGWHDDVAYQTFGFNCYVGTKVLVNDQLYGTVCFADTDAQPDPFSPADHALVRTIARRIRQCLQGRTPPAPAAGLEQSRNFLKRVQHLSRVGGWEIDLPEEDLRWTETTYQLYDLPFDYTPDVESAIRFFAEEARPLLRNALDQCITDGIPYNLELPLITAADTRRWVRVKGVSHPKQGTVRSITGTIEDITEEKEAQHALQEERDRFETLFQNLPTPVARCRVEEDQTPITAMNTAFGDVFDVSASDAKGTDINDILVPDAHRTSAERLAKRAVEAGTLEVEVERRTADGLRDFRLQVTGRDRPNAKPEVYAIYTDITELKERERTIREERDLLNRVFETSPTAIVIFDRDGNFVRASTRAQEILGVENREVMDRTYNDPEWEITTLDGTPLPDEELPFERVKQSEEPLIGVENAITWPDGSRRLLSSSGAPLHDADGTFIGAVFHVDDITERRRTRLSLEESEQRFRGVFENAALGIALVDETGHLLEANSALTSMMGYSPDELRGTHFQTVTHSDHVGADKELFEQVVQGTLDSYQLEKQYVRQDGTSFWGHLTVSRLDGPDDDVQVIGMVEDIDLQKTQREELRKFQTVVEHTHEAVLILGDAPRNDPGPPISYANSSIQSLTGYTPSGITGNSLQCLFGENTEPWVLDDLWTSLENGERHEGEALAHKKDGTPFVASWSIAPVRDAETSITNWVVVLRDVTERRQMGKRLLEVQNEERRRIDQELHDEMGGLLTTLQMTVELGRMEAKNRAAPTNRYDKIEEIVTQISSVTRTVSRRLHPKNLDDHGLSRALSSLVSDLEKQHPIRVHLHNEIGENERFAPLVEMTTFRIVQEALVNVIRHANSDDAEVTIEKVDNNFRLEIVDYGVGFDPSAQQQDNAYGLSGIRERVERLNGTFAIDSSEGEGTRLSVTLPRSVSPLPS